MKTTNKIRKPTVAVIVSNYNGATNFYDGKSILELTLTSLRTTRYSRYYTIVTDDNSKDNSITYVKTNFPEVHVVQRKTNGGFSANNNSGILYAYHKLNPDYYLLLNNDIIITDKLWLDKLVSEFESRKHDNPGIESCNLIMPDNRIQCADVGVLDNGKFKWVRYRDNPKLFKTAFYADFLLFACVLISKEAMSKIGLLDEHFWIGHEDSDWCLRVHRAGFRLLYNGKVSIVHLGGQSTSNAKDEDTRKSQFPLGIRNHTYYILKNYTGLERFAKLSRMLGGSVFAITDANQHKDIRNFRIKDNPFRRIYIALKSMYSGYKVYKSARQKNNMFIPLK